MKVTSVVPKGVKHLFVKKKKCINWAAPLADHSEGRSRHINSRVSVTKPPLWVLNNLIKTGKALFVFLI